MNEKVDWQYLFLDTRARVYLLWACLVAVGFVATHFFQAKQINAFWTFLSIVGLYYMYRVMPLKVKQMKHIFIGWLVTIFIGMAISGLVFILDLPFSGFVISHLGGLWLLIMAQGYAGNGYVDRPALWYYIVAAVNALFGILFLTQEIFLPGQYLLAAIVSAWSMLMLWLFRSAYN